MTSEKDRILSEKAGEAIDACRGQISEIIDLVAELMRQIDELKKEVALYRGNEE